jgi:hypothetical protein
MDHPDSSDEDYVKALFLAGEELPESTVTERFYKKQAEKVAAEHEAGTKGGTEGVSTRPKAGASSLGSLPAEAINQDLDSYLTELIPAFNEQARHHLRSKWQGPSKKNKAEAKFHDAMFESVKTPEDIQKIKDQYVLDLKKDRESYDRALASYEYQIENQTWDESFDDRVGVAWAKGGHNLRGMVARMGESVLQLIKQGPISDKMHKSADSAITFFHGQMNKAYDRANAPELQRTGRSWIEKRSTSLLENIPSIGLSAVASLAAFKYGGAWGAKMSVFWTGGSMESWSTRNRALENGFSEAEANKRAMVNFVFSGGIESLMGGVNKYLPGLHKAKGAFTKKLLSFPGRITRTVLEEIAEEVPETIIELMCTGDVPYNEDGSINYKEFGSILWETAQDAAFMATVLGSVSQGKKTLSDVSFLMEHGVTKGKVLAYADDLINLSKEEKAGEIQARKETATPLELIEEAGQFYMVQAPDGSYKIFDADEGGQYNKDGEPAKPNEYSGMTHDEAVEATERLNTDVPKGDPVHQLSRFITAQVANGINMPTNVAIQTLIDRRSTPKQRSKAAQDLKTYTINLKEKLTKHFDAKTAENLIPESVIENLDELSTLWDKGRIITKGTRAGQIAFVTKQERVDAVNELRHVLKLGQLYGEGTEADIIFREGIELSHKVKPIKGYKHKVTENPIKKELLKIHDMILGTSKNDVFTSLSDIFGFDHIPLSTQTMQARTDANGMMLEMMEYVNELADLMDISRDDKHKWSKVLGQSILGQRAEKIPLSIDGQVHTFSMAEIMGLNIALRDDNLYNALVDEGIYLPGTDVIGKIGEWEQAELRKALHANPKAELFVDALVDFYINKRGNALNEASIDELGYLVITDESFLPDNRPKVEGKPSGPVRVEDIFTRVSEDIREAANTIYIFPHVKYMKTLLNSEALRGEATKRGRGRHLRRAIESYSAMEHALPHRAIPLEGAINKLGANTARSILMNPRIVLMQAGSYMTFYFETDAQYLKPTRVPELLRKGYTFMNNRASGYGSTHSVVSEHGVRHMWDGKQRADYLMEPLHQVDITTSSRSLNVAYSEMRDGGTGPKALQYWSSIGLDPKALFAEGQDSPAFQQALYDRATYLTYMTQPMFFPESRNLYLQQDAGLLREIARFRGYTDQILRNVDRQMTLYLQDEISFREMAKNVSVGMAWSSFWNNGLKWLFLLGMNEFRKEEDKKEMNVIYEFITNPVSLMPFIGWTVKGGIHNLAYDDSYGPADFSTITLEQLNHMKGSINDILLGIRYSIADEQDVYGNWKSEKYIKRGMKGAAQDFLILGLGISGKPIELIPDGISKTRQRTRRY